MPKLDGGSFNPLGGEIYGHLFENPSVAVPRNVYWACSMQFAPLVFGEDEWPASLSFEWITWPIRRWQDLDGRVLKNSNSADTPEASLYLFAAHQPVDVFELSLQHTRQARFNLQVRAVLSVQTTEGEVLPNVTIAAEAEASFQGLFVVPSNVTPKPNGAADASNALEPFADLSAYSAPIFDRFRWVFGPNVVPAA